MLHPIDKSLESNLSPSHQNRGYQPLQSVSALRYGLKLWHFTENTAALQLSNDCEIINHATFA